MKTWVKIFGSILFGILAIAFRLEDWLIGTIICFIISAGFTISIAIPRRIDKHND